MERDRKGRIIAVTSMLIAVVFLTIAYAVFSKSLNIQNISATVKANEANFSVKFSKSVTVMDTSDIKPVFTPGAAGTAVDAHIDNSGANPKITNLGANFTSLDNNGRLTYSVFAINDGEFDAYFKSIKIANVTGYDKPIVCIPGNGTSKELVDKACKSLEVRVRTIIYIGGTPNRKGIAVTVDNITHGDEVPFNSQNGTYSNITNTKLGKYDGKTYKYQEIYISIGVVEGATDAGAVDGSYSVKIGDITLEYSTQD